MIVMQVLEWSLTMMSGGEGMKRVRVLCFVYVYIFVVITCVFSVRCSMGEHKSDFVNVNGVA